MCRRPRIQNPPTVDVVFDEIVDGMINASRKLEHKDIDISKRYKLIHNTMQIMVKMKINTIVDKLKARLCACGKELTEVDHETYYTTYSRVKPHTFPDALVCSP